MPDELDTLEESHDDATIAFNRAETAHRIAQTRTYRSDEAKSVALREADEDLVAAANTLSTASDALDVGVRSTRTDLADVDPVAVFADDAKVDFRRYWQVEAKEASLADLKQSLRIALGKPSLPRLAVITQAITRRLGDQPAGTFGERGYVPPKDGPDAAVRRDLQDLLTKAKAKLALTPDPEIVERLDALRDEASAASKRAKDRLPRRRYAFEHDDDRISGETRRDDTWAFVAPRYRLIEEEDAMTALLRRLLRWYLTSSNLTVRERITGPERPMPPGANFLLDMMRGVHVRR